MRCHCRGLARYVGGGQRGQDEGFLRAPRAVHSSPICQDCCSFMADPDTGEPPTKWWLVVDNKALVVIAAIRD